MSPFDSFFPKEIVSYITNSAYDFSLPGDGFSLTDDQYDLLRKYIKFDLTLIYAPRQIHGDVVVEVDKDFVANPKLLLADAIMTNQIGIPLGVRTADCLSVFFVDPDHHAIGLAHAGWRGTKDGIVGHVVRRMNEVYDTDPARLLVGLGPCIRHKVYRVGSEFQHYFPRHVLEKNGALFFDLAGVNLEQLYNAGVNEERVMDCGFCSYSSKECHSYRRDGEQSGRMLSVIMQQERGL